MFKKSEILMKIGGDHWCRSWISIINLTTSLQNIWN